MKRTANWILLLWTVLCVAGVGHSLAHTVSTLPNAMDNDEREASTLAVVFGAAEWLGIWAAVAVPVGILHLVSPNRQKGQTGTVEKPS
jgi:hypothetical protein